MFDERTDLDALEDTLLLSVFAAEGIYGPSRVRLDVTYLIDRDARTFAIDASSAPGCDVCRIFTSLATRQLGDVSFGIQRVDGDRAPSELRASRKLSFDDRRDPKNRDI